MTALGAFSSGDVLTAADLNAIGTWSSWSPTVSVTAGSSTITVNNAEFTQVNKLVVGRFSATVTAQGTGSGSVDFTLPAQPAYATDGCGSGRNAWTGDLLQVFIYSTAGNGTAAIRAYNNGAVVFTNYALHVHFVYEAA